MAVKDRQMSCSQQHKSVDFKWTWTERKTEPTAQPEPSGRRGEGLLLPGREWAVCLFFGGSQPEEVSLESWWVGLGSPGQSLCQAEAERRAGCKGRGPGVRWWRELFKHFFPCKLFRVARVVWSQRVISGVNCLHGQGNQFSIILQTAVFSELFF